MTIEEFIEEWNNSNDYIIVHTSGSTGIPKEIKLSKSLMYKSALRTNGFFSIDKYSHLHLTLSPDYIAGKMMIVRALISGAKLTYEIPKNILSLDTENDDIDLLAVVPSQLIDLLNKELKCKIKNIIVGGSSIPLTLREELAESDFIAYETYGMTETASHVALRKVTTDPTKPYFALPGIHFSTDNRQCLIIEIDNEYRYITNDVVDLIDDTHFNILGRYDDVIITGGLKVHPQEVENIISKFIPNNKSFYISSVPNDKWGEEVVLIMNNTNNNFDFNTLTVELKCHLKPYQIPKRVIFVDNIPLTTTGKVIRKKIIL